MFGGMNLREIHRLGVVRFMAPNAEHGGIKLRRSGTCGIFRVLGLRSMTGFAGYTGVAPSLFQIQNVSVAGFADFVASIGNRLGRDFLEGVTAKMAVHAKALRDEDASENKEKDETRKEDGGHTKEMGEVFGLNHRCAGPTKIVRTFVYIPLLRTELQGGRHA
jgi:hypothetical protein